MSLAITGQATAASIIVYDRRSSVVLGALNIVGVTGAQRPQETLVVPTGVAILLGANPAPTVATAATTLALTWSDS